MVFLAARAVTAGVSPLEGRELEGYARRVWHTEDGLPEETVQALAQTPNGFLWIATTGGLVRFDGARFTTFQRGDTPALRNSNIFCLTVSKDGTLWIGTEGGGLASYSRGRFQSWSGEDEFSRGHTRAILEDAAGNLLAGTDRGLFRKHGNTFERVDGKDGVPATAVHALFRDSHGRLWIGGFRLFSLIDGRATEYKRLGGPNDNVKSILESKDGSIWVGTVGGLQRMAPGESGFSRVPGIRSTVRNLREAPGGTLWISTIGEGVFLYANGRFSRCTAPRILPSNTVLASFEDNERNVWLGTQTGLLRLSRTAVSTFVLPNASDSDFGTIYEDRDGALWIAGKQLYKFDGARIAAQRFPDPLNETRIRNVFRDSSGVLWIGTEGRGAFRLIRGKPRHISATNAYIRVFAEDRDGSILIGTDEGVNRWRPETGAVPLCPGSTRALLVDRTGDLWVGKDQGLARMRGGVAVDDPITRRLGSEQVWAIHEDPEGSLWFGTRDSGLFRSKNGKLTVYTTAQGLASNSVYQILEDRRGEFWMSGPNGISSVSRRDLDRIGGDPEYRPAVKLYGTSDGLRTTQMHGGVQPAGCLTARGEIWFPSSRGPVRIGPDPELPEHSPPVFIYKVVADGLATQTSGAVVLKPGAGKLDIEFGAIRLRSPERVRFRYTLEGFDRRWVGSLDGRNASYTNLPPGNYRFRVQAFDMNHPDDTSEAALPIQWQAHFYRTGWFLLVGLSIVLGGGWVAHQMHLGHARSRFQAVLEERTRLAREMHDTLIQGCTSVSALLEASSSLENVAPEVNRQLIEHARTQIRDTIQDARRAVWNLRQPAPAGGTAAKIAEIARQVGLQSNLAVECTVTGGPVALADEVDYHLLLTVREALLNSVRHGRPSRIRVEIAFEPATIRVRILDDGCGFDSASASERPDGHYGMVGMRERIEHVGGSFLVKSGPGLGTAIEIAAPLTGAHIAGEIAEALS